MDCRGDVNGWIARAHCAGRWTVADGLWRMDYRVHFVRDVGSCYTVFLAVADPKEKKKIHLPSSLRLKIDFGDFI